MSCAEDYEDEHFVCIENKTCMHVHSFVRNDISIARGKMICWHTNVINFANCVRLHTRGRHAMQLSISVQSSVFKIELLAIRTRPEFLILIGGELSPEKLFLLPFVLLHVCQFVLLHLFLSERNSSESESGLLRVDPSKKS